MLASRYLVSFCNNEDRLRLATVTARGIDRMIDLGSHPRRTNIMGATGICADRDRIFVAIQARPDSMILELDREFEVTRETRLPGVLDLHGLALLQEHLIAVTTARNEVLRFDLTRHGDAPEHFWFDKSAVNDRDHLNDLAVTSDERLLVSCFGARNAERMRSGCVREIPTGRLLLDGLREQHSPFWWQDRLHVLESATGDLISCAPGKVPQRVLGIRGYARGLHIDDDWITVGKSGYRERSRHGLGENRAAPFTVTADERDIERRSGLHFIAPDLQTSTWVDTTACGPEIYQIIALAD